MLADILITILLIASTFLHGPLCCSGSCCNWPGQTSITQSHNSWSRPPIRRCVRCADSFPAGAVWDGASLVLAVIIQGITFFLILVALNGGIPAVNPITLLVWAVLKRSGPDCKDLLLVSYCRGGRQLDRSRQRPPRDSAGRPDHGTGDAPSAQYHALHGRSGPVHPLLCS